jgi:hypothetical protein
MRFVVGFALTESASRNFPPNELSQFQPVILLLRMNKLVNGIGQIGEGVEKLGVFNRISSELFQDIYTKDWVLIYERLGTQTPLCRH